jgi:hypothetical protein
MNFFGHATVAYERSAAPRFVLGAMLPDLAGMASLRISAVHDPELALGVELHHATDRAFHAVPAFRAACSSALVVLEPQGVTRASARAVGHVGAELLLDGLLSDDQPARAAYTSALDAAVDERLERDVAWHAHADGERLHQLLVRLRSAPLPQGYRDVGFVCDRLERILSTRPRLALQPQDLKPVRSWLEHAREQLARERDAILAAVRVVAD